MKNLWSEFSKNLSLDEWDALYSAIYHAIDENEIGVETTKDPEQRDAYAHRLETLKSIRDKLGLDS